MALINNNRLDLIKQEPFLVLSSLKVYIVTLPSMPFIPAAAPSSVEYRTKPNPFDQPDARSFTTLAAESKKKMAIKVLNF